MTQRRGIMLVVSSPSGTGKTTLCRKLIQHTGAQSSVSSTTRPPRPDEHQHIDYHFCSDELFDDDIKNGNFLEWAHIHGYRYGTRKSSIESMLQKGQDIVFDLDWQGAQSLKQAMPNDVTTVFLLPPSINTLQERLLQRPGSSPKETAKRLAAAKADIERWQEYQYTLVNDNLNQTFDNLLAIMTAAACRSHTKTLKPMIQRLLEEEKRLSTTA